MSINIANSMSDEMREMKVIEMYKVEIIDINNIDDNNSLAAQFCSWILHQRIIEDYIFYGEASYFETREVSNKDTGWYSYGGTHPELVEHLNMATKCEIYVLGKINLDKVIEKFKAFKNMNPLSDEPHPAEIFRSRNADKRLIMTVNRVEVY